MKPLSPQEVADVAKSEIPPAVIEAVNNLLKKKYRRGQSITLKQEDIMKEVTRLNSDLTSTIVYENGWMDFEATFEGVGWKVTYDKPGYNESYPATFEFTPKK